MQVFSYKDWINLNLTILLRTYSVRNNFQTWADMLSEVIKFAWAYHDNVHKLYITCKYHGISMLSLSNIVMHYTVWDIPL